MGASESLSFDVHRMKDPYFINLLGDDHKSNLYRLWDEIYLKPQKPNQSTPRSLSLQSPRSQGESKSGLYTLAEDDDPYDNETSFGRVDSEEDNDPVTYEQEEQEEDLVDMMARRILEPDVFVTAARLKEYLRSCSHDQPFFLAMIRTPDIFTQAMTFACKNTEICKIYQFRALLISIYVLTLMWKCYLVTDKDLNKKITRTEYTDSYENLRGLHGLVFHPNLLMCDWHEEFDRLDIDHNGYISFFELADWVGRYVIKPEAYYDVEIAMYSVDKPLEKGSKTLKPPGPVRVYAGKTPKAQSTVYDRLFQTGLRSERNLRVFKSIRVETSANDALISHLDTTCLRWMKTRRANTEHKVVLSPVREKQLREIYNGIDTSGAGLIDLAEIKKAVNSVQTKIRHVKELKSFRENILKVFSDMDDNGDGEIDFHEFTSAMTGNSRSILETATAHGVGALYAAFVQYGLENKRNFNMGLISQKRKDQLLTHQGTLATLGNLPGRGASGMVSSYLTPSTVGIASVPSFESLESDALPPLRKGHDDYERFCLFNQVFGDDNPLNSNKDLAALQARKDNENRSMRKQESEQAIKEKIDKVKGIVDTFVDENDKQAKQAPGPEADDTYVSIFPSHVIVKNIDRDRRNAWDTHAALLEDLDTYNHNNPLKRAVNPTREMVEACEKGVVPAVIEQQKLGVEVASSPALLSPRPSLKLPAPTNSNALYFDCPVAHDVAVCLTAKKEFYAIQRQVQVSKGYDPSSRFRRQYGVDSKSFSTSYNSYTGECTLGNSTLANSTASASSVRSLLSRTSTRSGSTRSGNSSSGYTGSKASSRGSSYDSGNTPGSGRRDGSHSSYSGRSGRSGRTVSSGKSSLTKSSVSGLVTSSYGSESGSVVQGRVGGRVGVPRHWGAPPPLGFRPVPVPLSIG